VGALAAATPPVLAASPQSHANADAATERQIADFLSAHPTANRFGPYQVAFDNASIVLTWPNPSTGRVPTQAADRPDLRPTSGGVQPADVYGCPSGPLVPDWYCFYQDISFGGRMLEFKDCSNSGLRQNFSDYGFRNETSSWVNTTNNVVDVFDFAPGGDNLLWIEAPGSGTDYVGNANNDRADYFITYC
jgi:hypothetical protein